MEKEIEALNAVIADDGLLDEAFDKLVKSTKPLYPFSSLWESLSKSII